MSADGGGDGLGCCVRAAENLKQRRAGVPDGQKAPVEWRGVEDFFDKGRKKQQSGSGRVGAFPKAGLSSIDRSQWTQPDKAVAWFSLGVAKFACEELGDDPATFTLTGVLDHLVQTFPIETFPAVERAGLANLPQRIRPAKGCLHRYEDGPGFYCTLQNVSGE